MNTRNHGLESHNEQACHEEQIVPIVIPAYEPDARMLDLVSTMHECGLGPIVIVNDGSGAAYDHLYNTVRDSYGVTVLSYEGNHGKGYALKTAFRHCLEEYPQAAGCVTADSDGQHTTEAIQKVKETLLQNPDCLVLGVRRFDGDQVPTKSAFGNNLTRKVFKTLFNKDVSDTQTGLRGIPQDFMRDLVHLEGDRFEFEMNMLIRAAEGGVSDIKETPVETIYDSKENHQTHFRPFRDSIRIYRCFGLVFGKFVLSSLSSSLIDLGLFQVLCIILRGRAVAEYVFVATIMARIVSATFNYLVNYHYVFGSEANHRKSVMGYLALAVCLMLCSAWLSTYFVRLTGSRAELFVKIPVDACLFLISYEVQKRLIF